MESKKHKRKKNHVVIVTSDAVDANVSHIRIRSWMGTIIIMIVCVLAGLFIGYLAYEEEFWSRANRKIQEANDKVVQANKLVAKERTKVEALEEEKSKLGLEIKALNEQIELLSATVNQKVEEEEALLARLNAFYIPSTLPVTGSMTIKEVTEGNIACIFNTAVGGLVLSAGAGTVTEVVEDVNKGCKITIDHGNGYVSVYQNEGKSKVKNGDVVSQGVTLFIIGEDNTTLTYQVYKDGVLINPMDVLAISG